MLRNIGVGVETDIFIMIQTSIAVSVSVVFVGMQSFWLPRLSELSIKHDAWKNQTSEVLLQCMIMAILASTIVSVILWGYYLIVGYSGEKILTLELIAVFYLVGVFSSLTAVSTMVLRSRDILVEPEVVGLITTVLAFAVISYVSDVGGVLAVAMTLAVRSVANFYLVKYRHRLQIGASKGLSSFTAGLGKMMKVFGASSLYKTSPAIDRGLLSNQPDGSVTVFGFSANAVSSITALIDRTIASPSIAKYGKLVAQGENKKLKRDYRLKVMYVILISLVYLITLLIFSDHVAQIIQFILKVPESQANSIYLCLLLLSGYLFVAASGSIPVAVLHSYRDINTPLRIGVVGFLLSLPAKWIGVDYFGMQGLVIAISIYYLINMGFMVYFCERRIYESIHSS